MIYPYQSSPGSFGDHFIRFTFPYFLGNSLYTLYCRLTFWLSNCVVLRAIVSEAFAEDKLPVSASSSAERNRVGKGVNQKSSILKWKLSSDTQANKNSIKGSFQDFDDLHTFVSALQKVESWIFSRIVESIWWQVLCLSLFPGLFKFV